MGPLELRIDHSHQRSHHAARVSILIEATHHIHNTSPCTSQYIDTPTCLHGARPYERNTFHDREKKEGFRFPAPERFLTSGITSPHCTSHRIISVSDTHK